MANTLLTTAQITNEALMVLENTLSFTKTVNREYDDSFARSGAKIGDTINIRKPVRYVGRRTSAINIENSVESTVPLTVNTPYGNDMAFTSADMALSIDEFSSRFIKPAVANISNMIDQDGLALASSIYNAVGTPGTTVSTAATILAAGVKLSNEAAPIDERFLVLNPAGQAGIVGGLTNIFNPQATISKQYLKGSMGDALGFSFLMDQNVGTYTSGVLGGTPLVNGVPASGATTLATDGWTAAALARVKAGDIFTIANVFAVNPQTRQSTGQLRQFAATAVGSSDGSGNMTISITPAIIASGQYQTVDALPADNAPITFAAAASTLTVNNLAYCKDAFTFACVDLPALPGTETSRVSSKKLGMSIRLTMGADIVNDRQINRLDLLGGWACIRPELACRVYG